MKTSRPAAYLAFLLSFACGGRHDLDVDLVAIDGAGRHACGVDRTGVAWCWGEGEEGQLGDGRSTTSPEPVQVAGAATWTAVSVSTGRACGLTADGEIRCWGREAAPPAGPGLKALTETGRAAPLSIESRVRFASVAVGERHACGVDPAGRAWCWGANIYGEVGDGGIERRVSPVAVPGRYLALAAGSFHTCGLDLEGGAWCWGDNQLGQLGQRTTIASRVPVRVQGVPPLTTLALARTLSCGLDAEGRAYCWGRGASASDPSAPVAIPGLPALRSLDAAGSRTCGVDREGRTHCWNGVPSDPDRVERIGGDFLAAAVYHSGACGIRTAGGATCRTPGAGAWPAAIVLLGPFLAVVLVGWERGWVPTWVVAIVTTGVTVGVAALLVPLIGLWWGLVADETGWFFVVELGALGLIGLLVSAYLSYMGLVVRAWRNRTAGGRPS